MEPIISDKKPFACQLLGARDVQEDSYCFKKMTIANKQAWLMAVADGMGGQAGGKQASELAVKSITDSVDQWTGSVQDIMRTILDAANRAIKDYITEHSSLNGMGCTLLVVICIGRELYWLSIGDSILYVLNKTQLLRINEDHSMNPILMRLLELGRISQEEYDNDARRHQLCSHLNGEAIKLLDVCEEPFKLEQNSLILLASDGIDSLTKNELSHLLTHHKQDSNKEVCSEIINQIEQKNRTNQDNTTLIVYKII